MNNKDDIISPKGTTALAALISGRSGGNYAKKLASAETPTDLKAAKSGNAETHERIAKGTALSVFKKGKSIPKSSENMHSPPSTRRES